MKFNWFKRNIDTKSQPQKRELTVMPMYSGGLQFGKYALSDSPLTLSAVFAAMELISNSLAIMPIRVKKWSNDTDDVVVNHPLNGVLSHMRQTRYMWVKQMVWDMLQRGNSYSYIVRKNGLPSDIIYLHGGSVSPQLDESTGDIYYLVSGYKNVPSRVEAKDMIHLYKNSRNGYIGVGVLAYAYRTTALSDYTESSASDFFGSGCNIKGILKFKGFRDDTQKNAARQSWNEVHGSGASGLAIMDADADFVPISQNAKDSQMVETRTYNVQEIARFFNINPVLLQDLSHSSYSTIEAANIEFVEHTLLPYVELIQCELQRKLLSANETDYHIDIDETVLLRGDKTTMANYISTLRNNGIITTNEARRMLDLNPVEGGDEIIIPFTDVEMNTVGGENNEVTDTQADE